MAGKLWPTLLLLLFAGCSSLAPSFSKPATAPEPPLSGTTWVLVQMNGHDVLPEPETILHFVSDSILGGETGCNDYGGGPDSGGYHSAPDGSFGLNMLAVTVQLCPDEALMAQEGEYTSTLIRASHYHIEDGLLHLYDDAGNEILTFRRANGEALLRFHEQIP